MKYTRKRDAQQHSTRILLTGKQRMVHSPLTLLQHTGGLCTQDKALYRALYRLMTGQTQLGQRSQPTYSVILYVLVTEVMQYGMRYIGRLTIFFIPDMHRSCVLFHIS